MIEPNTEIESFAPKVAARDIMPEMLQTWGLDHPVPCDLILADPPWHFKNWGGRKPGDKHNRGRGAGAHYFTMSNADICAMPVEPIAAPDSVLLMWFSWPQLPDALEVIAAWGFQFKTRAFTWVKPCKSSAGGFAMVEDDSTWRMTQGYATRSNDEACLLATRGNGLKRLDFGVRSLIVAPLAEHSAKPEKQYSRIDRLYGTEIRRIELFARRNRANWVTMGYDINHGADIRDMLRVYAEGMQS